MWVWKVTQSCFCLPVCTFQGTFYCEGLKGICWWGGWNAAILRAARRAAGSGASSGFLLFQVWADPAGGCDTENGWEVLQGAHWAADPDLPAQVSDILCLSLAFVTLGASAAGAVGETCLKPKQSIFGFQVIDPTQEGFTLGTSGACIVWVGLGVMGEDRGALVEVWVTLLLSHLIALAAGWRWQITSQRETCLSFSQEWRWEDGQGWAWHDRSCQKHHLLCHKNSQRPAFYLMPVSLCRVNTVAGTSRQQQCFLISPAPDSSKSFNLCLHSYIFTWADAFILDFQNPDTFPWKGLEA